jgi:ribosomal-protein-alanine N-acetyltransferase
MNLNHKIVVDSEISISEFTEHDKQSLVEYLNDPFIFENTANIPNPYTPADADWWIARKLEQYSKFGQPVSFAIRSADDKLIGAAGFDGLVPGSSYKAELGYWLAKPFRGQGIMPAVVQRLCLHAFSTFALEKITAFTYCYNKSSRAVLEKAGFYSEGYFRKDAKKGGRFIDCYRYALLPKHTDVTQRLDFAVLNGEIVVPQESWVYVWQKAGSKQIEKIGATWLHPAARAEKHLRERDEEDAMISSFRVPKSLDRSKIRDALSEKLTLLGFYSGDQTERIDSPSSTSESAFADEIIKDLNLT